MAFNEVLQSGIVKHAEQTALDGRTRHPWLSCIPSCEVAYAQRHVRIVSGVHGLLRPFDGIQPFTLPLTTKVKTSETLKRGISAYWRPHVTKVRAVFTQGYLGLFETRAKDLMCSIAAANIERFRRIQDCFQKRFNFWGAHCLRRHGCVRGRPPIETNGCL